MYDDDQECLEICPDGTYANDTLWECDDCDPVCKTCVDSVTCETCDTTGDYPFFYSDYCYSMCPTNYCSVTFICETPCTAKQFLSVTVTASPTTINTASTLTFVADLDPANLRPYQTDDLIFFTVPTPGAFTPSTLSSLCSVSTWALINVGDRFHNSFLHYQCKFCLDTARNRKWNTLHYHS